MGSDLKTKMKPKNKVKLGYSKAKKEKKEITIILSSGGSRDYA